MTPKQREILRHLRKKGPSTSKEIGLALGLSSLSIGGSIAWLHAMGKVKLREKTNNRRFRVRKGPCEGRIITVGTAVWELVP